MIGPILKRCIRDPISIISFANVFKKNKLLKKNSHKKFFFVQIGANDGISHDPIRRFVCKYNWSGLLVEPQKDVFEKLQYNYRNQSHLVFENSVVSNKRGKIPFYISSDTGLSSVHTDEWFKGRNAGFAFANRKRKGGSKKVLVNSLTFEDLCKKHSIAHIDLLQIDAEGYDYEIIKLVNLSKIKPKMIQYEDHHLEKKERKDARAYLKSKGYTILLIGSDCFAYLKK